MIKEVFGKLFKAEKRNNLGIERKYFIFLNFKEMTEEWLDFIVKCRSGSKHKFDVVTGAMANDQIYNYISDFINNIITREQFWVLAKFKYPTHQICFSTKKALGCLKFVDSKICE